MSDAPRETLHFVEGHISNPRLEQGHLYLSIDGREVCLNQSHMLDRFHDGEHVRLMIRPVSRRGVFKVLAWQRYGQRRIHYTGIRPSIEFIMAGIALLVGGVTLQSAPLIASGIAVLMLQLILAVWKTWTFHRFRRADGGLPRQRPPMAEPLAAPEAPLDLRALPQGFGAAHAGNWPAEILEFTHDAIIIWEMGGAGILYWNRAAEQLYGYTREEARGRVTHELLRTQLSGGVNELETRVARYGLWVGTLRHTRKDGQHVEVEGRLSLMSQDHGPWLVLEVNRDVTDRNAAELARNRMEAQLALLRERSQSHS
jgi:PAS domain S-box-containing protein